jgi:hypothetical protein
MTTREDGKQVMLTTKKKKKKRRCQVEGKNTKGRRVKLER